MKTFGIRGPVTPEKHYVVPRTAELADFIARVQEGHYIVLFAPRQTGKTTFFRTALAARTTAEKGDYFPIQLNFEIYEDCSPAEFYKGFSDDIREEIVGVFRREGKEPPDALTVLLENTKLTTALSMRRFFTQLGQLLIPQQVVLIIDEFDAIPPTAVKGFLRTLRHIYLSGEPRCPHSVGIVGVKNITQLNYDSSISPFNIQEQFSLPNFTRAQVQELLGQYTAEVGQPFESEVVAALHRQTAGQPFLVNRAAQILTQELEIPKTVPITLAHWAKAHAVLLEEDNVNFAHLTTNIRRDSRFGRFLMRITSYEEGVRFSLRNEIIDELATYGVISKGSDGMCEIANPMYHYVILQTFEPEVNGLEHEYFCKDTGDSFRGYLTASGDIAMERLLDNFCDFIARAGFRILQVPALPQEYVGQHLLFAYLDNFVRQVRGTIHIEVPTGRGRMDVLVTHNLRQYIVETKIWQGEQSYQAGKRQLAAYLKVERASDGYYVVFDHRSAPVPRVETETVYGFTIRSYVIPVVQARPSELGLVNEGAVTYSLDRWPDVNTNLSSSGSPEPEL